MKRYLIGFAIVCGLVGGSVAMRLSSTPRIHAHESAQQQSNGVQDQETEPTFVASRGSEVVDRQPLVVEGAQPYALDQPRVPALLQPVSGGPPLSVYAEEAEGNVFAFDAFLDTGSSRIALSHADTAALKVQRTGRTVEDIGIGGKELFDVAVPYRMRVGDSRTNTQDERQFRYALDCVLELRQNDTNLLHALPPSLNQMLSKEMKEMGLGVEDLGETFMSAVSIIGTPFIQRHVVVLDPRTVTAALGGILGSMGGEDKGDKGGGGLDRLLEEAEKSGAGLNNFGRIDVRLLPGDAPYATPQIVVPLTMKDAEVEQPPVSHAKLPFIAATLQHGSHTARGDLLVDTGGGVSLISPTLAQRLGLNLQQPQITAKVQGVGQGSGDLKGYWVDRMTLPALQGGPVIYLRAPFFVANIAGIDGSIGMNLLGPSVYLNLSNFDISNPLDLLNSMRPGPLPFQHIVIDLPHRRLGLDPA